MALIPVNYRGVPTLLAVLDDEDAGWASEYTWRWERSSKGSWYVRTTTDTGRQEFMHRLVLEIVPGKNAPLVDHINGLTFDNRRCNLRIATTAENAQNQGSRGGSSRFRGVTWDRSRGKWMASAMLDGRRCTIGRFDTEAEAGWAAAEWRREHMPFSDEARTAA